MSDPELKIPIPVILVASMELMYGGVTRVPSVQRIIARRQKRTQEKMKEIEDELERAEGKVCAMFVHQ